MGELGFVLSIYVPVDVNTVESERSQKIYGTCREILNCFIVFNDIEKLSRSSSHWKYELKLFVFESKSRRLPMIVGYFYEKNTWK